MDGTLNMFAGYGCECISQDARYATSATMTSPTNAVICPRSFENVIDKRLRGS
jgi:hypothetical protein